MRERKIKPRRCWAVFAAASLLVCAGWLAVAQPQEAHAAKKAAVSATMKTSSGDAAKSLDLGLCSNGGKATATLEVTASPAKALKKVTWSVSGGAASVSGGGGKGRTATVTAASAGTAKVTAKATFYNGYKKKRATMTASVTVVDDHSMQAVEAKAATCTASGHTAHQACAACGLLKGYAAVPALGHSWKEVAAKDATCTASGHSAYKACKRCGAESGKTVTAALGHNLKNKGKWFSNGSYHYNVCGRCKKKLNKAEHAFVDGKCTVCGRYQIGSNAIGVKNYSSRGRFVQGFCATPDGASAFVYKQNVKEAGNLQRIDLSSGESTELKISDKVRAAILHGNGLAYAKAGKTEYLLAAPSKGYIAVLKVGAKKAALLGKVSVASGVIASVNSIAVSNVSGTKATCLVAKPGKMAKVTVDLAKRSAVKRGAKIAGYSGCNQGISVGFEGGKAYVYGCGGGWEAEKGHVTKWLLSGSNLKKVWRKSVAGEPQGAAPVPDGLWVAVERETKWNEAHGKATGDKLLPWTLDGKALDK